MTFTDDPIDQELQRRHQQHHHKVTKTHVVTLWDECQLTQLKRLGICKEVWINEHA